MPSNEKGDELRLGFLSAVEVRDRGYVGGLLVTNRFGRPLEFQCTSPVQPNRMQEILYGPTLVPYVLAELIGTKLMEKVGIKPHVVLAEQEALLELRNFVTVPVAWVTPEVEAGTIPNGGAGGCGFIAANAADTCALRLGRQFVRFHASHTADRDAIAAEAAVVPAEADLCEPFGRVREALEESARAGNGR
jgi:hypothetical protein